MLTAMLAALLGGIILNVMPCVFPIVSLKALGLMRHDGDAASARTEGLGFLLGTLAAMMVLAGILLAIRAGGSAVGWGFQLQSPLVIAALALVILGAALNLLGVFEVGLSLQRAGEISVGRGAFVRSALTGALAIFFALAVGFAAPFTMISLFPALARRLPRPGPWMGIVKRALAFPMFGAYAWLVWVLAQQAGSTALATLLAGSVVLSFAAWLYGIAQQRQMLGRGYRAMYAATALLLLAVIAPLPGVMKPADAPQVAMQAQAPMKWSPQAVAENRGHGRTIFVNFTASWCITCQVNDKTSLSTAAVKSALARTDTLYMVADSTKFNADIDDAMSQFGQGGLPLYVVYPADGGKPRVLPQVLTPAIVVNALDQAAGKKA